jgi:uncharacterized membrane protein YeaQ/YmgE (transglycosylase-associated protein family)
MGLLSWIVFGLIAGGLAKLIMPGKDPGGCLVTILIGIVGAVIGGFIGAQLGYGGMSEFEFNLGSLFLSIHGAVNLLVISRMVIKSR